MTKKEKQAQAESEGRMALLRRIIKESGGPQEFRDILGEMFYTLGFGKVSFKEKVKHEPFKEASGETQVARVFTIEARKSIEVNEQEEESILVDQDY